MLASPKAMEHSRTFELVSLSKFIALCQAPDHMAFELEMIALSELVSKFNRKVSDHGSNQVEHHSLQVT